VGKRVKNERKEKRMWGKKKKRGRVEGQRMKMKKDEKDAG
jgi:hypothetical protein